MNYVMLWFILLGGSGYIEPMDVKNPPCGVAGTVVGVQFDRAVNPTQVVWPDPYFPGVHCVVDITAKVATLQPGEYQLATTILGATVRFGTSLPIRYIGHDPHTTDTWTRLLGGTTPTRPLTFRVIPGVVNEN